MPERGYGESLEKELFREEFPFGPVSRRGFLALGLLTLAACTPVVRRQGVPYVRQPEWVVEGGRAEFVTAIPHAGIAEPVLVRHYQERPLFLVPLEAAMSPYPWRASTPSTTRIARGRAPTGKASSPPGGRPWRKGRPSWSFPAPPPPASRASWKGPRPATPT
jgi:hypothetical protein